MKTHIMRWAPQDWRTSRVRSRGARRGDQGLRLVYLELLFALFEAGGTLPDRRVDLEDELALPWKTIQPALRTLAAMGKIERANGHISNGRVLEEVAEEKAFRQEQSEKGRRGARARAQALRAIKEDSRGQAAVEQMPKVGSTRHRLTPPPAPPPPPTPPPAPAPAATPADAPSNGQPQQPAPAGIDYDPDDPLHVELVRRCKELAEKTGDDDWGDVLRAVSGTPKGRTLDSLRGAPEGWVQQTLRACDDFEADL